MALVKSLRGFTPVFGKNCFLADNAVVIGDVTMGDDCSVWFGTVIRGDVNTITIGNRVNIQDGSVLHCTWEKTVIRIGDDVSVGHNVILHGAIVENNVLIGMGAIVMDGVRIGENSIVAAGSVVLENTVIEPGSVYGGVPARFIKKLDPSEGGKMIARIAGNYPRYVKWYDSEQGYNDVPEPGA